VIVSILSGLRLLLVEVAMAVIPLAAATYVFSRTPKAIVHEILTVVRAGLLAGAAATFVYDLTRTTLSVLDPSPYNPFEAIRRFGSGVLPADAAPAVVLAAGFAIHFLNGSSFGVIYAIFGGRYGTTLRRALINGMAWGLTLEFIQSILYPGWLHITTVLQEFLVISGLGHLMYGVTLGLGVHRLLHRGSPLDDSPSAPQARD
jgi:hypothetical protein